MKYAISLIIFNIFDNGSNFLFMRLKMPLVICFIFFISMGFSQKSKLEINPVGLKKNVIYGTLGVEVGEFYGTILGNYERMIIQFPNSFFQSFWMRVGAGCWGAWGDQGSNYISTLSMVMGKKSAHLEIGSGVVFTYHRNNNSFYPLVKNNYLAGNLGFRFQKPGGYFILRTGMGWPEYMYLSLGFCF